MVNVKEILESRPPYKIIKKTDSTVVAEAQDYFYKVRSYKSEDPTLCFDEVLLTAFADEYKEWGLDWSGSVQIDEIRGLTHLVERRERLRVACERDCSYETLLKKSGVLFRRIERKIGFDDILNQVCSHYTFREIQKVRIARDLKRDYSDFAWWGKDVVMLGNTGMFLALLNNTGNWQTSLYSTILPINLRGSKAYFASKKYFDQDVNKAGKFFTETPKWWIYSDKLSDEFQQRAKLEKGLEDMFSSNLKVLITKQKQPLITKEDL